MIPACDLEAVYTVLVYGLSGEKHEQRCKGGEETMSVGGLRSRDADDVLRSRTGESWMETHMSWANDSAVPVAHHDIVAVLETVRARSIADALLALLELLEQSEIAGNCTALSAAILSAYVQHTFSHLGVCSG